MKKAKRALMETPPSSSYPVVGEEARARYRHESLMQDYQELLKETEAKRKKMQMTVQKKHRLSAEVKFLRRKYKTLLKNPAQETQFRLKKPPHMKIPPSSVPFARPRNPLNQTRFAPKGKNHKAKEVVVPRTNTTEAATPRTLGLLDLNQVCVPSSEEMQELQMGWVEAATENDIKLSICREPGSNSNRAGKRRISWQDQVTLRV